MLTSTQTIPHTAHVAFFQWHSNEEWHANGITVVIDRVYMLFKNMLLCPAIMKAKDQGPVGLEELLVSSHSSHTESPCNAINTHYHSLQLASSPFLYILIICISNDSDVCL